MVEDLVSGGADDALAVGVHPGRLRRALDHSQLLGYEDGVESLAVLAIAVMQQEAQGLHTRPEVGGEVPGLLHSPVARRMGGDAGDVQTSGVVFEKRQRVQELAERCVDVEEVRGDDAFGFIRRTAAQGDTATDVRYGHTGSGDTADLALGTDSRVQSHSISLPGGALYTWTPQASDRMLDLPPSAATSG